MTYDEIRAAIGASPELQALVPDTQALAMHPTFSANKVVAEYWLTDRGLVADLVTLTGTTAMSDSVLNKLDAAAASSRSVQTIVNRLYNDTRGINFGDPATVDWFQSMTPAVFTEAERDALVSLALQPSPVSEFDIRRAIFNDNGSLKV